jgi:prephenate dehydrogenase
VKSLGIVGFGSFGRFMARHLSPHFELRAHDRRDVSDEAARLGVECVGLAEVAAAELLVLAVPVQDMEDVLRELAGLSVAAKMAFDVGSVKVKPMQLLPRYLPDDADIVGLHPMFGPQSGRDGIAGLKIVVCPQRTSRLDSVLDFLSETLGLEALVMTPEEHDAEIAYVQGLTHWIAKALREITLPDPRLATPAYRHLVKIEEILREDSMALFHTIQAENPYSADARRELLAKLLEIEALVASGPPDEGA